MGELLQIEPEKAVANPFGGGMDWLEVRVPQSATFRPVVNDAVQEIRRNPAKFHPGEHYGAVIDLRDRGIEAMLHYGKKHGNDHNHKIQLIGSAQYSWGQNLNDIEQIVDCDPLKLQPMRTDLTVDVENVPMNWVINHTRVAGKRFSSQRGEVETSKEEYTMIGTRELQTAYVGKRPNCFRVYDKKQERLQAYRRFVRGWHEKEPTWKEHLERCEVNGLTEKHEIGHLWRAFKMAHEMWAMKVRTNPKPTFEQFCGLHEDTVLTRFERQIGAQQVGKIYQVGDETKGPIFSTLKDMKTNLPLFNPFHAMEFSGYGRPEPPLPNGDNYSLMTYMAGMYFRDRIEREGLQAARAWATPLSNNNMKAILARLAPFLPAVSTTNVVELSGKHLYQQYQAAILKQLAA